MHSARPKPPSHPEGFTLVELLAVVTILAVIIALIVPVLEGMRERGLQAKCVANLRAIGPAFQLYLQDNQMQLPWRFQRNISPQIGYKEDLAPYLGHNLNVFKCPAHSRLNFPTQPSYGMNYFYDHAKVLNIPKLSNTILLAETSGIGGKGSHRAHRDSKSPGQLAPTRHGGKSNYLFFDGGVRYLPFSETITPLDLWGVNPRKKRN